LKEKGFSEVHFHDNRSLPSRAHYKGTRNCSFRWVCRAWPSILFFII